MSSHPGPAICARCGTGHPTGGVAEPTQRNVAQLQALVPAAADGAGASGATRASALLQTLPLSEVC
eukprot:355521-Chlamydomonas_euryale.AAC.3